MARRARKIGVALLALCLLLAVEWVRPAERVRVMPLGDSITAAPGCWRALLWQRLRQQGHTGFDFTGTRSGGDCPLSFDPDHAGYSGFQAVRIAEQRLLPGWLAVARPDIVLVHLGTNDLYHARDTGAVLNAFARLVEQMRAHNPAVRVLFAQIIPMAPAGCPDCPGRVAALNAALPDWAAARSTARSPITVVDQWTGFDPVADTVDGVHPNAAGFAKMAARWHPALSEALAGHGAPELVTPAGRSTNRVPPPG